MAITYPLSLPSSPAPASIEWSPLSAAGVGASPFTFAAEKVLHAGRKLEAAVSYPPMTRAQGDAFAAALTSLDVSYGNFLFGPQGPGATPKGPAGGTPLVFGVHAKGVSALASTGWSNAGQLVVNGAFPSNINSWTTNLNGSIGGSIAWAAPGVMRFTQGSNSVWMRAYQAITLVAGTIYSLAADRAAIVGGGELYIGISANSADGIPEIAFLYWAGVEVSGKATTFSVAASGTYYFKIREGSVAGNSSDADSCSILPAPLHAGDWLQVGSGSTSRLHLLLQHLAIDNGGTGSSNFPMEIWPQTREALANGAAIVVASPKGLFRLKNRPQWSIGLGYIYEALHLEIEEDF